MRIGQSIVLVGVALAAMLAAQGHAQQPYGYALPQQQAYFAPAQAYAAPQQQAYLGQQQQAYSVPQQQVYLLPAGYLASGGNDMMLLAAQEAAGVSQCETGCGEAGCGEAGCGGAGCGNECGNCCLPRWRFFGDYLYLRPRNAEVVYGVAFNGPVTSPPDVPIQIAPTGIVDFDYENAFRVGFTGAVGDCSSIGVSYTYFFADTAHSISTSNPYVIRSMVSHPSTIVASSDGLDASATHQMDFDLVDVDFRHVISCSELHMLNWLAGARYGNLNQIFRSQYAVNGLETVSTDIQFEGGGIRVGLEGERRGARCGFTVYGRGSVSFIAGEVSALYAQGQAFDRSVVDTSWKAGRIVTMLDLEIGIGWTSCNGCVSVTGGYMVSAWHNAVKTDEWIQAVQQNNFIGLGDMLTFDGLTARAEVRF